MKKTSVLDGAIWLVYSIAALGMAIMVGLEAVSGLGVSAYFGIFAAWVVMVIAILLDALVQHVLERREEDKPSGIRRAVAEGAVLVVIVAGTFVWNILAFGQEPLSGGYEAAKVVSDGAYDPGVTNGAMNLYLRLLHGVLWVFGNSETAVYGLQLALFMVLLLVCYFGARSLYGPVAAVVTAALIGVSQLLHEHFMTDTANLLFCLVIFLAFWSVVSWWNRWNRYQEQRSFPAAVFRCLLTGVLIGLAIYMDASAAFLVVLYGCVLIGNRKPAGEGVTDFVYGFWNLRPVSFLLVVLFGAAAYGGLLCLTGQTPEVWLGQYQFFPTCPDWLSNSSVLDAWIWEFAVAAGLLVLGVFTSVNRLGTENSGLGAKGCMLLSALILLGQQCFGLQYVNVDNHLVLYLLVLFMAGMSVADLFSTDRNEGIVELVLGKSDETENEAEPDAEPTAEAEAPAETEQHEQQPTEAEPEQPVEPEAETEPEAEPEQPGEPAQVTYLESPLPLPKKHVHKDMDYDIEVADDDDYDIQ